MAVLVSILLTTFYKRLLVKNARDVRHGSAHRGRYYHIQLRRGEPVWASLVLDQSRRIDCLWLLKGKTAEADFSLAGNNQSNRLKDSCLVSTLQTKRISWCLCRKRGVLFKHKLAFYIDDRITHTEMSHFHMTDMCETPPPHLAVKVTLAHTCTPSSNPPQTQFLLS